MLNENRVIVAMSGGVDSSVAAALLKEKGFDVIGVTMKTWGFMEVGGAPKFESGCCSLDAIYDAKNVADALGISHYTIDFTKAFENTVIENFVSEYLNGRTPNPCVLCNRKIKWEELLLKADSLDAKYVATGHYAKVYYDEIINRFCLQASKNKKDQSYALWGLSQQSLSRTIFPLGDLTKPEVRKLAERYNLKTAHKSESQEICFVADNNYERFLRERIPQTIDDLPEGDFIFEGKKIGRHKGIPFYTVGQRKGLGISVGTPLYVKEINKETNSIILSEKDQLNQSYLEASDINYVSRSELNPEEKYKVKIRYNDSGSGAEIVSIAENYIKIKFDKPKSAVTPGQSVVLYDSHNLVVAGGIIEKGS